MAIIAARAQFDLGLPDIRQAIDGLAVQIAGIQGIRIDQPETSHPGTREILHDRTAEAAGADDQNPGAGQCSLAAWPDFLEEYLP